MNTKHKLIWSGLLCLLAIIFTTLVAFIDVGPAGPEDSLVGFSALNADVAATFKYNALWYQITKILGFVLAAVVLVYAGLGVKELIQHKSFKKVHRELYAYAGLLLATLIIYFIFDKILVLNFRPVLMDGVLEPSYPSSHTLFAVVICFGAIAINQTLFPNSKFTKPADIILVLLAVFTVLGRLFSGVHWLSDIVGGVVIASALLALFYTTLVFLSAPIKTLSSHERHQSHPRRTTQ